MKYRYIILFIFICFFSCGQEKPILLDTLSSKQFNEKLFDEFTLKYEIFNKKIDLEKQNQKKILKETYFEKQKYFLDLIKSNNFISDINVNLYLRKLLEEVLNNNGILSKDYKILLSKNSEINAYNIGDRTIVVNYGLFLTVENEDELVFVISHEIGHQYLNHVKKEIEKFVKQSSSEEIIKRTVEIRKQKYKKGTLANNLLKNIYYEEYKERRQQEIQADSIGFLFYKNTERNVYNAVGLLKKLDVSDEEKDSLYVSDYKSIFEKNEFKLKSSYFQEEKSLFQKYDYKSRFNIDSLKTHPDCKARIELLEKSGTVNNKTETASNFFNQIKKNAVYQNLYNLYQSKDYCFCLYETLKQFKKNKKNDFYKHLIYLNLVEIYNLKANYKLSKILPPVDYQNYSDSKNTFITFINNVKLTDLELIINQFK